MIEQLAGNIIDIHNHRIFSGVISMDHGIIVDISENSNFYHHYIGPGFVDAHVHIESSMLTPEEFSKLAIAKGTIAIVNDPHEIANVLGMEGIRFMIENARKSLIKMFFSIPSCVPATPYDLSGAKIDAKDVEELINTYLFVSLSEVMNISGVIRKEPDILRKIELAHKYHLQIDGHAPGITGEDLSSYINAGISTDHELVTLSEALEKISLGMKILIREGSAAKNYESLKSLINTHPDRVMFCTDDSHPGDLIQFGHIDKIVKRAVEDGYNLFEVLKIASLYPIQHYHLSVGTLQIGDPADFCIFKDLESFSVSAVYLDGELRYSDAKPALKSELKKNENVYLNLNKFNRGSLVLSDLKKSVSTEIVCIHTYDGDLITDKVVFPLDAPLANLESDLQRDILKIVYLNRYEDRSPQIAFIHGIGLKKGAFATSISHDSHNIIAVGCSDQELLTAINAVISNRGGLSVVSDDSVNVLPLPIAGIMSDKSGNEIAVAWNELIRILHENGCVLSSPFMTLSFMALIVIPELKIGEKGLFEYSKFDFLEG